MADLESSFRAHVLQQSSITDLVSDRIYWNKVADNAVLPYVKLTTVTDNPSYHQQGESIGRSKVQLDIFDDDKGSCNSLTGIIRTALSGFRGAMGNYRVRLLVRNVNSDWEDSIRMFRRILEVEIGYAI